IHSKNLLSRFLPPTSTYTVMHIASAVEINSSLIPKLKQFHTSLDSKVIFLIRCA
ncbi:hypothetical protein FRX31_034048, partial [Thalictrum thalictroides]